MSKKRFEMKNNANVPNIIMNIFEAEKRIQR